MSLIRYDRILVVDTESTCWQDDPPANETSEIIQIGVAEILLGHEPSIGRTGSWLVRPRRSNVSAFCTELTGITNEDVKKRGRWLNEVAASIRKEFGGQNKAWTAWGRDDVELKSECDRAGVESPFSDSFIDLGALWTMLTGKPKAVGLRSALDILGLEFEGTPHRALDDAINTARVFCALSERLKQSFGCEQTNAIQRTMY